jgi:hypothetical protein
VGRRIGLADAYSLRWCDVSQLEHPRSAYAFEFRQIIFGCHTARVKEQREQLCDTFALLQETQIAARMRCDKVDRYEAMRRSLDIMHGNRTLLGEEIHKVLEEEKEKLTAQMVKLERWAVG